MSRSKSIDEASFSEENIPEVFYIGINMNRVIRNDRVRTKEDEQEIVQEILTFVSNPILYGVKGITENYLTADTFGNGCIIVMPGMSVVRENRLTRIMYNNEDYLISHIEGYARVSLRSIQEVGHQITNAIFSKITDDVMAYMSSNLDAPLKDRIRIFYDVRNTLETESFARVYKVTSDPRKRRNLNHFIKSLIEETEKLKTSLKRDAGLLEVEAKCPGLISKIIERVTPERVRAKTTEWAYRIVGTFSTEKEWMIKNDNLKVPSGSKLIFTEGRDFYPEDVWRVLVKRVETDQSFANAIRSSGLSLELLPHGSYRPGTYTKKLL